jgi:threonine aldolase
MLNRTDFRSDNVTGASPEVLRALEAANADSADPYGEDPLTRRVEAKFAEVFETDCAVFPVATGTAANSLALATLTPPYGAIFCHEASHVNLEECGAPEFFSGGAKMVPLPGAGGKITAADLAGLLAGWGKGSVYQMQASAMSLTQTTESGTTYKPAEIAAIAEVAKQYGVRLHMDGARFANAVVGLNASPADVTWRAGVTALSFGATKNGTFAAEAVVLFDKKLAAECAFRRKRGGHVFSKMRFLSAQLDAYLADEHWLENARHANAMAKRLADGLARIPAARLAHPVEANEVFVHLPEKTIAALEQEGFGFYRWDNAQLLRLVGAWNTDPAGVERFLAAVARHSAVAV